MNVIRFCGIALLTIASGLMVVILSLLTLRSQWGLKFVAYHFWGPGMLLCAGAKLKVEGLENIPDKEAVIFVANHESQMDIPALFRSIPKAIHFVAKKELRNIPFLGWAIWASGMIFVDRKNRAKAMQSMKNAAKLIKAGKNVISFPEGTRSKTKELGIFKKGSFIIAQSANISIVPIAISGSQEVLAPGGYKFKPGTIHVKIGEKFSPEDYPSLKPNQLADITREKVIKLKAEIKA